MKTLSFALVLTSILLPARGVASSSLAQIYELALTNNPELRIANHLVAISEAQEQQILAKLRPQLTSAAELSRNRYDEAGSPVGKHPGTRLQVAAQQSLFSWQIIADRRRARETTSAAEFDLLSRLGQLGVDVATAYVGVLSADRELRLIEEETTALENHYALVSRLHEKQLSTITDVYEAEARLLSRRTDYLEAGNAARLAREEIRRLTGVYVEDLVELNANFVAQKSDMPLDYWEGLALQNNPDRLALLRKQEASLHDVSKQRGGRYPEVSASYQLSQTDLGYDRERFAIDLGADTIPSERKSAHAALDLSVPVYSGGTVSARIRQAKAAHTIAVHETTAETRALRRKVRELYLFLQSATDRIAASESSVVSAGKAYEATVKSFALQAVNSSDVLHAASGLTRAKKAASDAKNDYILYWIKLRNVAGELDAESLLTASAWFDGEDR